MRIITAPAQAVVDTGVDLDPDVLHGDHGPASGRVPVLLKEYRLGLTG